MKQIFQTLRGDKGIWGFIGLLMIASFLPIYSASTNLVYIQQKGTIIGHLMNHFLFILIGFFIIYFVHKMPYHYFRGLTKYGIYVVIILLLFTLKTGVVKEGAFAARSLNIPFVNIKFQTATLAFIVVMIFTARYLSNFVNKKQSFRDSFIDFWLPIYAVVGAIFPANFSTAVFIFSMICMLLFIGMYPLKHLFLAIGIGILGAMMFYVAGKNFGPQSVQNKITTWENRIKNYGNDDENKPEQYQIERSKIAIATGGTFGLGVGKSIQKNFIPESTNDFIYAVIVEEYGLILGGLGILFIYFVLFFRFWLVARNTTSIFGRYLVIGLGFSLFFQAIINMGVAVELFPTTGQTLPLISSGGTSIWMTCAALGIILSVSKKEDEIKADLLEKQQREEALQRIIDREVELDNNS